MFRTILAFVSLLSSGVSLANSKPRSFIPDKEDGRISFYFENDIFSGTDRDYTNGGRLAWISDTRHNLADVAPFQQRLDKLSGSLDSSSFFKKIWGFESSDEINYQYGMALTQLMYTPTVLDANPPLGERPYAGWLGLGMSLHVSNEKAINSVEFIAGTVGPNAFAAEVQDFVHSARKLAKFEGWDSQIPNEFTFNIHFNQKRRYRYVDWALGDNSFSMDGFTETAASLGNFRTDVSFGYQIHAGFNLPINFSDPRLSPTANAISWNAQETKQYWSAYLIVGAKVTGVLRDITIDGPMFRSFDTGISREPLVGEIFYGFGLQRGDWEMSYIQTTRTREYKEQDGHQDFGSFVMRYHY